MTMPDDGSGSDRSPKQRKLRPWWRWNLITLALVLFVVLWVREFAGMRLASTFWMVFGIFLFWWVAPSLVLRRLPWPLSLCGYLQVGESAHSPSRRRAERVCHAFAILLALGGLCQLLMAFGWIFQVRGNFGRGGFGMATAVVSSSLIGAVQTFGIAAGLWTIGSIASAVGRLAEFEEERQAAGDASGPQG